MKVAIIQMNVMNDKQLNMNHAVQKITEAAQKGADIVILPEMFNCPYTSAYFTTFAEPEGDYCWKTLSETAEKNAVYLVGGSMPEKEGRSIYNTCYVFDRNGQQIAKHRKVHLFDIDIKGGQQFKESDTFTPGNECTVFTTEFCKIGVCICFDFRFPELSRTMALQNAQVIIVPAAFNMTTGPAHWELLFRQRAVDNQLYTIGVAPARNEKSSYVSYAHSIVCSAWGTVVQECGTQEETAIVTLDLDYNDEIREQLPLLSARRPEVYRD